MKQNKKVIIGIIIAVIILVAIIGILSIIYVTKGKIENDNSIEIGKSKSMFDSNNLIKVEKDEKIGYMTSKGKMVIEPQYEEASPFYGNYALVEKDGKYIVINQKGEEQYKTEYKSDIEYIELYNIWIMDEKLYDNNLNQITSNNTQVEYLEKGYLEYKRYEENEDGEDYDEKEFAGIMDYKGKTTCECELDEDTYFYADIENDNDINNEVYATIGIEKDDIKKEAIINCKTGKVVIDFTENEILAHEDNIFSIHEKTDGNLKMLYYAYIEDDKIAYKLEDGRSFEFFNDSYSEKTDKILQIEKLDGDGIELYSLIDGQTYEAREASNAPKGETELIGIEDLEYKIFKEKGDYITEYGIKEKDNTILNAQYHKIEFLPATIYKYLKENENKQIILLRNSDSNIVYDLNKKEELFKFDSGFIDDIEDTSFIKKDNTVYNVISGKSMNFDDELKIEFGANYLIVEDKQNKTQTYYNTDLQEIYKQEK